MKKSWFDGLTDDQIKEVRGDFKSSLVVRNRLRVLIEKKIESARDASLTKGGYEVANWAFKQADGIGYERALKEVIDLITE